MNMVHSRERGKKQGAEFVLLLEQIPADNFFFPSNKPHLFYISHQVMLSVARRGCNDISFRCG